MKKTIALLLALLLVLALTACGEKSPPAPTEAPTQAPAATQAPAPTEAPEATEAPDAADAPEATEAPKNTYEPKPTDAPKPSEEPKPTETPDPDFGLINLYLPPDFVGDMTEEDMQSFVDENGIKEFYPQEDGGVVYVMTEETHKELLQELSEVIEEALMELTEGEDSLASLRGLNHNEDYSAFEFIVDRSVEDGSGGLYALSLTLYGAYYQAYCGAFEPDCLVELKDAATGEVYDSVTYQDWLAFLESLNSWDGEGEDWGDWESTSTIQLPELESPVVLLDEGGVTVTATGFEEGWLNPVLNLHVVNNSDQAVCIGCDRFILNGYSASGFLYTEVQPGSEADDSIGLYDDSIDLLGTEYIGEIDLRLYVNNEEYDRIFTGEPVVIRTGDYDKEWKLETDGDVVFADAGLTMKLVSITWDDTWKSTDYTFLLKNDSGRNMSVTFSKMLVNGTETYPWFYETVYAGTMAVGVLSVSDDALAEIDVDVMTTLEVAVSVDDDNYEEITSSQDLISLPIMEGEG